MRSVYVFPGAFVRLIPYRPQTESYGNPFPPTTVPQAYKVTPGVGVRRNGDNDDNDAFTDLADPNGVAGENDLIEVEIKAGPKKQPRHRLDSHAV